MTGSSEQFTFQNKAGETLSGSLELPDQPAIATALFAHCFSCNKNCLLYTSPSPRDKRQSRMPSSA